MNAATTTAYALSIAGFDPSAGAGVLSDVKTFEGNGVYGFGVATAITFQNDIEFDAVEWLPADSILRQVSVLLRRFPIRYIKIGLIRDFELLQQLITYLHREIPDPVIVFDPILSASAGFRFHDAPCLATGIKGISVITPNIPEAQALFGVDEQEEKLLGLSQYHDIYLKGGHADGQMVQDVLYHNGNKLVITHDRLATGAKHGSGCVLSSALAAGLALGETIELSAQRASDYVHGFLASSDTLLGHHHKVLHYEGH